MKLFVYGTLKPGFLNFRFIQKLVLSSAPAIVTGWEMKGYFNKNGKLVFPVAVRNPEKRIQGFVLEVADPSEVLRITDRIEGYPVLYQRVEIPTSAGKAIMYYGVHADLLAEVKPLDLEVWK